MNDEAKTVFDEAHAETIARIRADRARAPRRLKPLLAYLEDHLFDPDLDYQRLKKVCSVRDNNLPTVFHRALGLPPAAYIRDCRLETAWRLLTETDLKIGRIGEVLGYSSIQTFGRAFKRWCGVSPAAFRRRQKKDEAAGRPWTDISPSIARRAVSGQLNAQEVQELLRRLLQIYPNAGDFLDPKQLSRLLQSHAASAAENRIPDPAPPPETRREPVAAGPARKSRGTPQRFS